MKARMQASCERSARSEPHQGEPARWPSLQSQTDVQPEQVGVCCMLDFVSLPNVQRILDLLEVTTKDEGRQTQAG